MTFSYGNIIVQNRFVENAICGIWGGYSCGTIIAENTFDTNGQMGLRPRARRHQHRARGRQPHRRQHLHREQVRHPPLVG
jgi:parallel beta-helix repeat protein